jgi:hypothetical protein
MDQLFEQDIPRIQTEFFVMMVERLAHVNNVINKAYILLQKVSKKNKA